MNSNPSPPTISLTGAPQKPRSRAGTLPASFMDVAAPSSFNLTQSPLHAIDNSEPLGIPYTDTLTLGLPASSPPSESGGIDIPGSNGSTRRMRSGSLFSSNSIWNDDNLQLSPSQGNGTLLLDNSSIHSGSNSNGGSFFSPALGPQQFQTTVPTPFSAVHAYPPQANINPAAQANRNRSYTTTSAVPVNSAMSIAQANQLQVVDPSGHVRLSTSPFRGGLTQPNDMNFFLDNLMVSMNTMHSRNRAQTYSGAPVDQEIHKQPVTAPAYPMQQDLLHEQSRAPVGAQHQPVLQDDVDLSELHITTNFDNPNLGPTSFLLVDNLPNFIDSVKLWSIFNNSLGTRSRGSIRSLKVATLESSKLALVECSSVEIAMTLKASFNHFELVPGVILYTAFALVVNHIPLSEAPKSSQKTSPGLKSKRSVSPTKLPPVDLNSILLSLINLVSLIAPYDINMNKISSMLHCAMRYPLEQYKDNFGPLPEAIPLRQFDSPKLRELRKMLEICEKEMSKPAEKRETSEADLEELAVSMLDELPELCYDYLGNTVIQKLFTVVTSPVIRLTMVREIAPYLTQLGIHKNGTWAIQKIINLCDKDYNQMQVIADSLKPYSLKMFNDQFGNYVLQACIKFGSPFNDFIIETILNNFLEISSGRFGARCIRTMLELAAKEGAVSREQVSLVASLIVVFSDDLIVNSNGSLLLAWFLDTFNGFDKVPDHRYKIITDKVIDRLPEYCTHKLANLTVLKILNNRVDPEQAQRILDRIFGPFHGTNDAIEPTPLLEYLLSEAVENNAGPLFLYKIVSNPAILSPGNDSWNNSYQQHVLNMIRRALLDINVMNVQLYRKLMDEVGLTNNRLGRSSSSGARKPKKGHRSSHGASGNPRPHLGDMQPMHGMAMSQYNPYLAMQYGVADPAHGYRYLATEGENVEAPPLDSVVMQQLEQLSLSSAALGYNSNPGTPGVVQLKRTLFF